MSLAARCPWCETVFRLTEGQISVKGGMARCGICGHTFNALDALLSDSQVAALEHSHASVIEPPPESTPVAPTLSVDSSLTATFDADELGTSAAPDSPPATEVEPVSFPPGPIVMPPAPPMPAAEPADSMFDAIMRAAGEASPPLPPDGIRRAAAEPDAPAERAAPAAQSSPMPATTVESAPGKTLNDLRLSQNASVLARTRAETRSEGRTETRPEAAPAAEPVAATQTSRGTPERGDLFGPAMVQPSFMASLDPPPRSRWRGFLGGLLVVLLLVGLAGQVLYFWRTEVAAQIPALRPWLVYACSRINCVVAQPASIDQLSIESSELVANPQQPGVLTFNALVRNHSLNPVAYPSVELTLTDARDQAILRRVFSPSEYLPEDRRAHETDGMSGNSELAVKLNFSTSGVATSGYRAGVFYP